MDHALRSRGVFHKLAPAALGSTLTFRRLFPSGKIITPIHTQSVWCSQCTRHRSRSSLQHGAMTGTITSKPTEYRQRRGRSTTGMSQRRGTARSSASRSPRPAGTQSTITVAIPQIRAFGKDNIVQKITTAGCIRRCRKTDSSRNLSRAASDGPHGWSWSASDEARGQGANTSATFDKTGHTEQR